MITDKTDTFLHKGLCYEILGCVYDVRNAFGSGQKEKVYQNALAEALNGKSIKFEREVTIIILSPKTGNKMGTYRLDFVIDKKVIMETKALTYTPKKIEDQLYSYLRSTPFEVGYLVNFGSTNLYIKRVILTNDRKPYFNKIKHLFNLSKSVKSVLLKFCLIGAATLLLLSTSSSKVNSAAGIPKLLNFQGRLTDASDDLLTGTYYLCFSIHDAESAGNQLWPAGTPTTTSVSVSNGVFSTQVGSADSLTLAFNDDTYYLNVYVNDSDSCTSGGENLTPRQRITAAGYAINAAGLIGDGSNDIDIVNTSANVDIDASTMDLSTQATAFDLINSTVNALAFETNLLSLDTNNARVGIGTTAPQSLLHVGSAGTLGSVDGTDDLYIYDDLEIDGTIFLDGGTLTMGGTGTLNGLDAVDATTEDTIEALIFDADAESIAGVWEVQDNVGFIFGNDANFTFQYDESGDDRLEITATSPGSDVYWDLVDSAAASAFIITNSDATYKAEIQLEGGIRAGSAGSPGSWEGYFDGEVYVSDYLRADGGIHVGGTADPGTDNLIVDGTVGIGTTSPDRLLDVAGDAVFTGTIVEIGQGLYHDGDADTHLAFYSDRAEIYAGGEFMLDVRQVDAGQDYIKLGDGGDIDINLNDDAFIEGSSGNVGIGTTTPSAKLEVSGVSSEIEASNSSFTLDVANAAGNIILEIDNSEKARLNSSGYLGIGTTAPGQEFEVNGDIRLDSNGTATTNGLCHSGADADTTFADRDIVACSAAPGDIAEWYDTNNGEPGDIVSTTGQTITYESPAVNAKTGELLNEKEKLTASILEKTNTAHQQNVLGVISTSPYQTFGKSIIEEAQNPNPIAIAGRVPVRVSTINGSIEPGDPITTSSIPGVGMKATRAGLIIGRALDYYEDHKASEVGKILLSVNISWYDPDVYLTDNGDLEIITQMGQMDTDKTDDPFDRLQSVESALFGPKGSIERIGAFSELITAKIRAGAIGTKLLIAERLFANQSTINNLTINNEVVSPIVKTEQLGAKNIEASQKILSPIVETNTIKLNNQQLTISNQSGEEIASIDQSGNAAFKGQVKAQRLFSSLVETSEVRFTDSELRVTNNEGKEVASVDSEGNAGFEGHVKAQALDVASDVKSKSLTTENAEVTNTLKVKRLEVEEIYSPFGQLITQTERTQIEQINTDKTDNPLDLSKSVESVLLVEEATISGQLIVKGKAYFLDDTVTNNTTVTGDLSQGGTLFIRDGEKVDNLAGDLEIQGEGRGDTVFGREMARISKEGTVSAKRATLEDNSFTSEELEQINAYEASSSVILERSPQDGAIESLNRDSIAPSGLQSDNEKGLEADEEISNNPIIKLLEKVRNVFEVKVKDKLVAYLDNTGRFFARVLSSRRVETSIISPLDQESLAIRLSERTNGTDKSRLAIQNFTGTEVASIDSQGTGTFSKLTIGDPLASSTFEVGSEETSKVFPAGSIGSGIIPDGRLFAMIKTTAVTKNSKIFITPTTSTGGQSLYISDKARGQYFIVSLDQAVPTYDVGFDWWIIN